MNRRLWRGVGTIVALAALAATGRGQTLRLGHTDFPTSGAPQAQEHFLQGLLLLHSFEYQAAARAFQKARTLDPDFAMAYWGEAMTYNHPVWFQQDREAARAVLQRLGPTPKSRMAKAPTPREQAYLSAVEVLFGEGEKAYRDTAYAEAMGSLAATYPHDENAVSFYALSLLGTSHGGRDLATYMRAAAAADPVFRRNPRHPGAAHYLIHSYDDPLHAPLGLPAARAYSKIAPDAAHAQHMTTHIFVALGLWDDVVAQNEVASGLVDWRAGHYTYWLEYGYLQQGRYRDAETHLVAMRQDAAQRASGRARGDVARMRAHYVIDTRRWDSPAARWELDLADAGAESGAIDAFVVGLGALRRGDRATASAVLSAMRVPNAPPAAEILAHELEAALWLAEGRVDDAVGLMRDAAAKEDALPFEFGPPAVVKPSHELLGEMLIQLKRPTEAQAEFERALQLAPKRALSLLGLARAASAAGNAKAAAGAYKTLHQIWHRADSDLLEVDEITQFMAAAR